MNPPTRRTDMRTERQQGVAMLIDLLAGLWARELTGRGAAAPGLLTQDRASAMGSGSLRTH